MTKAQSFGKGSATLEILIAMAVLTLSLTAVILVFSANQSLAVDTGNASEALGLARASLESARAASREDFFSLTGSSASIPSGPLTYMQDLALKHVAPFVTQATSTVSWSSGGRTLSVVLSTLLTDAYGSLTGDTCSPTLEGDWTKPSGKATGVANPGYSYFDFPSSTGTTGMDIAGGRAYLTTDPSSSGKSDFFVVDVTDHGPPGTDLKAGADWWSYNTTYGLTDVRVSGNYAYVAAHSATEQLLILDKSDPAHISLKGQLDVTAAGDTAYGNTLTYDYTTHRVYLGLTKSSGSELHIIDVSDPAAPSNLGSYEVGAAVNQILVSGTVAYLATASTSQPTSEQVIELDVSNPAAPGFVAAFVPPVSPLYGQSLLLDGNTLYFGRVGGGATAWKYPQLYSLNATTLAEHWSLTTAEKGKSDGVNRMVLRSPLLFVAADKTNGGFEIYDVSGAGAPDRYDTTPLNIQQSTTAGFDCEGNLLFMGERSGDALQIIGPHVP